MRRGRPRKDGGGDATDIHIIMQLRKTITLGEYTIEFRNGDKLLVDSTLGNKICSHYSDLNNQDKFDFQDFISASKENFLSKIDYA